MNTWNSELVESLYEKQALGYITTVNGQVRLHDHAFAIEYRRIVEADDFDHNKHDTAAIVAQARAQRAPKRPPFNTHHERLVDPVLGCVAQWLSELGKTTELQGLCDYADEHLQPTWENGGLFYPRRDLANNENDEWTHMDPFTGNVGLAYGRLNVKNGQKTMFERPWTSDFLARRPWIDSIDLTQGVDVLRGIWDEDHDALVLTVRTWDEKKSPVTVEPVARNLEAGVWAVYVDGTLLKHESAVIEEGGKERGSLSARVTVGREDVDVVFQRIKSHQAE